MEKKLGLSIEVREKDILDPAVFEEYVRRSREAGIADSAFPVVFMGDRVLNGEREIRRDFKSALREAAVMDEARTGVADETGDEKPHVDNSLIFIPVLLAGLLDGVNPCAFTTLIFLIAFLTFAGKSRKTYPHNRTLFYSRRVLKLWPFRRRLF
jgi:hypothetical protein